MVLLHSLAPRAGKPFVFVKVVLVIHIYELLVSRWLARESKLAPDLFFACLVVWYFRDGDVRVPCWQNVKSAYQRPYLLCSCVQFYCAYCVPVFINFVAHKI